MQGHHIISTKPLAMSAISHCTEEETEAQSGCRGWRPTLNPESPKHQERTSLGIRKPGGGPHSATH